MPSLSQRCVRELAFDETLHVEAGAPATAWLRVNVSSAADGRVGIDVTLLDKTSTRLPDAMCDAAYLSRPTPSHGGGYPARPASGGYAHGRGVDAAGPPPDTRVGRDFGGRVAAAHVPYTVASK